MHNNVWNQPFVSPFCCSISDCLRGTIYVVLQLYAYSINASQLIVSIISIAGAKVGHKKLMQLNLLQQRKIKVNLLKVNRLHISKFSTKCFYASGWVPQ